MPGENLSKAGMESANTNSHTSHWLAALVRVLLNCGVTNLRGAG